MLTLSRKHNPEDGEVEHMTQVCSRERRTAA